MFSDPGRNLTTQIKSNRSFFFLFRLIFLFLFLEAKCFLKKEVLLPLIWFVSNTDVGSIHFYKRIICNMLCPYYQGLFAI